MTPEEQMRHALSRYFNEYEDAQNAGQLVGRLMILSGGSLNPHECVKLASMLFPERGDR